MKKMTAFTVCLMLLISFGATAQSSSARSTPISYRTYTSFPAFPLLALDSSKFNSVSVMNKKKPVIIIYFSPTCGHCQHQAEEITSHMKEFKDIQFLMVSSYSLQDIKPYVEAYGLKHFSNITVANDPTFAMGQFFELKTLPGIFVYDKAGKYKTRFETNVLANDLSQALASN